MVDPESFEVLLERSALERRIAELAADIDRAHPGLADVVVVPVIEGARVFCAALLAHFDPRPPVHEIRARSYGDAQESSGTVTVEGGEFDVADRTVLVVEDIVDTGRTIARLRRFFLERGAGAVHVATLLTKPARRVVDVELEHVGFAIDDRFVVGFGMDYAGRYRDLPHVAVHP